MDESPNADIVTTIPKMISEIVLPSTPSYLLHNTTRVVARTLLHSTNLSQIKNSIRMRRVKQSKK